VIAVNVCAAGTSPVSSPSLVSANSVADVEVMHPADAVTTTQIHRENMITACHVATLLSLTTVSPVLTNRRLDASPELFTHNERHSREDRRGHTSTSEMRFQTVLAS
jgi:hypothetical protein